MKILKVEESSRSIQETGLCIHGLISLATPDDLQAYEMHVDLYEHEESLIPDKTIIVNKSYHADIIKQYGMPALLQGIKIDYLFGIINSQESYPGDLFKSEVESIASNIVDRLEHQTFFDDYSPDRFKEYIENKILDLKQKFKIEPK